MKFCSFYPNLQFLPSITQFCYINLNVFFLENWQFLNHKLAPPLLFTYQAWKSNLTIWQNMKVSAIQKFQFPNSLVNWQKFGSTKLIFNNQYFICFMNWKKLESSTRATLTNANFQFSFCDLGKNWSEPETHIQKSPFWI